MEVERARALSSNAPIPRICVATVMALFAVLLVTGVASAASGHLTQKPGTAGCVSETGTSGACQDGVALRGASAVAVSPDGKSVYVAAALPGDNSNFGSIAIFDRNTTTGALTQKPGTAGCVSETGTSGACQDGVALTGVNDVAVSPDGKSVYVSSYNSGSVAIFDRDTTTGALTQKPGTAGCVSDTGTSGACQDGVVIYGASGVTVSPDGKSVYVTALIGGAVAIFDRDTTTGELTQKPGTAGCVSHDTAGQCQEGEGFGGGTNDVAVSPDGKSVYVTGREAMAILDRNTTTGALTQKPGAAGCVSSRNPVCQATNPPLLGLDPFFGDGVTVSPDGASVYVARNSGSVVMIFDRDTTTGALTQKPGAAGCVSDTGTSGACQDGVALSSVNDVAVSPDGKSVYASAYYSDSVAIFDRNTTTGALTQKPGTAGCVSDTGTSGACQDGVALDGADGVAVSPGGASTYVVAGPDSDSSSHAVAIFDRHPQPYISIDDVSVTEGNAGQVTASFTASLDSTSGQDVTVDFTTSDGTATAPGDYASNSGTVTFAPGDTSEPVNVKVNGDTTDEPDKTFNVNLSNASTNATISDNRGVGTITDDDPAPAISIDDVTVTEGDAGQVAAIFTASLDSASDKQVTVDFTTSDGTATAPDDYEPNSDTVTFAPGDTTEPVIVQVNGGSRDEPDETFNVDLSNATNATIADNRGVGTITDDDPVPPISIDDATVTEGNAGQVTASFTASLGTPSMKEVTVDFTTSDGTATAPGDYASNSGTVTFAPGDTSEPVNVKVNGDTTDEPDKTFNVNLSNATNATIADNRGVGTIVDDDPAVISIDDVTVSEGNAGQVAASFTASLGRANETPVTVDFDTSNGTATAPGDYTPNSDTVTFAPGETSQPVNVQVNGDAVDEPDETFNVDLSNATNGTITDNRGVGTIANDDQAALPPPAIGDIIPPETTITKSPKTKTGKQKATFEFSSSEPGSTFQCKLDDGQFAPCTSPQTVKVKKGKHSFEVSATDQAGNVDPGPASFDWKVKKKK